jgi:hypothetical protein
MSEKLVPEFIVKRTFFCLGIVSFRLFRFEIAWLGCFVGIKQCSDISEEKLVLKTLSAYRNWVTVIFPYEWLGLFVFVLLYRTTGASLWTTTSTFQCAWRSSSSSVSSLRGVRNLPVFQLQLLISFLDDQCIFFLLVCNWRLVLAFSYNPFFADTLTTGL